MKSTEVMSREEEILLVALSLSDGQEYTPVQVQKLLFLIDKKVGKKIGGPFFNFEPYHYGPFDSTVYHRLDKLKEAKLVQISSGRNVPRTFALTDAGRLRSKKLAQRIDSKLLSFMRRLDSFVRESSFKDLVLSIYKEYPEMKVNSIFFK